MKKADLSVNVIIVTIIALIVLIILTFVFTGRLTLFNQKISDCKAIAGNECEDKSPGCNFDEGFVEEPSKVCLKQGTKEIESEKVCCMPLLKKSQQS